MWWLFQAATVHPRSVFKTLSNIYDGAFLWRELTTFSRSKHDTKQKFSLNFGIYIIIYIIKQALELYF